MAQGAAYGPIASWGALALAVQEDRGHDLPTGSRGLLATTCWSGIFYRICSTSQTKKTGAQPRGGHARRDHLATARFTNPEWDSPGENLRTGQMRCGFLTGNPASFR